MNVLKSCSSIRDDRAAHKSRVGLVGPSRNNAEFIQVGEDRGNKDIDSYNSLMKRHGFHGWVVVS